MKISTRGRYATRALAELAVNYGKSPLSLARISDTTGISIRYLEQIMRKLKKNNIVNTIQGVKGGYVLSRKPEDIFLSEVIQVLEGTDYPVECVSENYDCCRKGQCATHKIWNEIHDCIYKILSEHSIKDLI